MNWPPPALALRMAPPVQYGDAPSNCVASLLDHCRRQGDDAARYAIVCEGGFDGWRKNLAV
jgi:hypothetical protein